MIQRPRNRQGRGGSQTDRGRGSGGRGRGGGRDGGRQYEDRELTNVPNINQVAPGGFVSIVLKVDQPTGREVQGVVEDVLTCGNHPRGIKVRLLDGRVGRVQRMVTEAEAKSGSEGLSGLGRNGEQSGGYDAARPTGRMRYRDVREDEMDTPPSTYSLGDFLPTGHPLLQDTTTEQSWSASETAGAVSTCPVCGEFTGDAAAVSHHVNGHFEFE